MSAITTVRTRFSVISRYRFRLVSIIAVSWTVVDVGGWIRFMLQPYDDRSDTLFQFLTPGAICLRTAIVFSMSLVMGYLLVFKLRRMFRYQSMYYALLVKTLILIIASFFMTLLVYFTYALWTLHLSIMQSWLAFTGEAIHRAWLAEKMVYWLLLYLGTQVFIEINEKYAPGVLWLILIGRYTRPVVERRIIMFLDLKDSTRIAEQLGHELYFLFIRDFIYEVSIALIEYGGLIYQYVGDEIVVSWLASTYHSQRCIQAVIAARRAIESNGTNFRRRFGLVPEFRVGIHLGNVTVGEIGAIKKDLAMSGDTMNTTARIRSACAELHHRFVVSGDFVAEASLTGFQTECLGFIELKGKKDGIELFALRI